MAFYRKPQRGFTLIEIAAVLVILALLVGGIISGQSLIHSTHLHGIIDDEKTYNISLQLFKDKYKYLPGDFPGASKVWSGAVDGNGNDVIDYTKADGTSGSGVAEEAFQAWQQLQLAGMIQGSYSGLSGTVGAQAYSGGSYSFNVNAPGSAFDLTGWMISYIDNSGGIPGNPGHMFNTDYRKWIGIGSNINGNDGTYADDGFLTNADAYSVDKKIDDGKPFLGMVHGMGLDTGCATAGTVNADYALSSATTNSCALLFSYDRVAAKRF